MADFINDRFLLKSDRAYSLYMDHAKDLPIIDYHCHLPPEEIANDIKFGNITDLWLKYDHYKWRLMRSAGVDEEYITGSASDKSKFLAWAKVIGQAWGNPLYHWTSLELARYFDIYEPLNEYNAEAVWEKTSDILSSNDMTASYFLKKSNVELLCTTDDPVDDLRWHKKITEDGHITTRVLPTFRPDPAFEIRKSGFRDYISSLSSASGIKISSVEDLKAALSLRMDHFASVGCVLSDHGFGKLPFLLKDEACVGDIFLRAMSGDLVSEEDDAAFKTDLLLFCAREYSRRDWTMQMHFGCLRDSNKSMFDNLGVNIGCDTILGSFDLVTPLASLMSLLESEDCLPRMILYSLDPSCNAQIDTLIGCFQKGPGALKIQHGSAWWFNDNLDGMMDQIRGLARQSWLPGFIGMLTDSRSFLSYPRHEYFRRILCNILGASVDDGTFPDDDKILAALITGICHDNAARYFIR